MPLPAKMLCPRCGYDRRNNYTHDPYTVCPECGDDRCPGELKPWPSNAAIAWRLMRVQVCGFAAVLLVVIAQGLIKSPSLDLTCGLIVARVALIILFAIVPFFAADAIAEEYAPERSRTKAMFALIGLGWLGGLILTAVTIAVSIGSAMLTLP